MSKVCPSCGTNAACSCWIIFGRYNKHRPSDIPATINTLLVDTTGVSYYPYYMDANSNSNTQETKQDLPCFVSNVVGASKVGRPRRHVKVDLRNAVYSKDRQSFQTADRTSEFRIIRGEINDQKLPPLSQASAPMLSSSSSPPVQSGQTAPSQSSTVSTSKPIPSMTPSEVEAVSALQAIPSMLASTTTMRSIQRP